MHFIDFYKVVLLMFIMDVMFCRERRIKTFKVIYYNGTGCGEENVKIVSQISNVNYAEHFIYWDSSINVKEDITGHPMTNVDIKRCKSKENLDQCYNFKVITSTQYCDLITSSTTGLRNYFSSIVPKWNCPIKKGTYKSTNASVDITNFLMLPTEGWFWRIRYELLVASRNSKRTIMCINLHTHVTYVNATT